MEKTMMANVFRFEFDPSVSLTEAEMSLHLAIFAVEGLYGEARVRLEVSYQVDQAGNAIIVDAGTEVGSALVKVYTRLLIREFGEDGFHVRPVDASAVQTVQVVPSAAAAERAA
jgi:hypothetical protein